MQGVDPSLHTPSTPLDRVFARAVRIQPAPRRAVLIQPAPRRANSPILLHCVDWDFLPSHLMCSTSHLPRIAFRKTHVFMSGVRIKLNQRSVPPCMQVSGEVCYWGCMHVNLPVSYMNSCMTCACLHLCHDAMYTQIIIRRPRSRCVVS
jgi:hypothetical protein